MNDETKSIDMTEGEPAPESTDTPGETTSVAQAEADPGVETAPVAESGADSTAAAATGAGAAEGGKRSWRGRSNASKRPKAEAAPVVVEDEAPRDEPQSEQPVKQKKPRKEKKEKPVAEKSERETKERKPFLGDKVTVNRVRSFVGRAIWLVCVVFALSLALTALFVALSANTGNEAVVKIYEFANGVDFGIFDLSNPIKDFDSSQGPSQDVRTALFNYGIAAILWLLIGRVADRVIQP